MGTPVNPTFVLQKRSAIAITRNGCHYTGFMCPKKIGVPPGCNLRICMNESSIDCAILRPKHEQRNMVSISHTEKARSAPERQRLSSLPDHCETGCPPTLPSPTPPAVFARFSLTTFHIAAALSWASRETSCCTTAKLNKLGQYRDSHR